MILITGASGQLGTALRKLIPDSLTPPSALLDISNADNVRAYFSNHRPDVVINCAAYNFVDLAETHSEECFGVNAQGALYLAEESLKYNSYMIHISSDYVFDGRKAGAYEVCDKPLPLSVYGRSKAEGEKNVLATSAGFAVVRTSWLFSELPNNFVSAIIRAGSTRDSIDVVYDQVGSPTYAADLAAFVSKMVSCRSAGLFQATNDGFCSRAEFAEEILRLSGISCTVNKVTSSMYPAVAERPKNSRMSKASLLDSGLPILPDWKDALNRCIMNRKAQEI